MSRIGNMKSLFLVIAFLHSSVLGVFAIEPTDTVKTSEVPDTLKSTVNLEEMVVTHDNIEHKGNQDRITITKKMREGKRMTGQLLGNLQGFTSSFDGKEISYMGSPNIIILVDSLEKDQDYVKRLDPGRFQSIDVVYRPIGKYGDYDVLINLRTKPHYVGTEILANAFANFAPEQKIPGGLSNSYANIDFTHTLNKTNFYATGGTNYYSGTSNKVTTTSYPLNNYKEETYGTDKDPSHTSLNRQAWGLAAFDLQIDNANALSISYKFFTRDDNNHNRGTYLSGTNPGANYDVHTRTWDRSQNSVGLDYNGNIKGWDLGMSWQGSMDRYKTSLFNERSTGFMLSDRRQYNEVQMGWESYAQKTLPGERWAFSFSYDGSWRNMTADALVTGTRLSTLYARQNRLLGGVYAMLGQKVTVLAGAGVDITDNRSGNISDRRVAPSAILSVNVGFNRTTWLRTRYDARLASPTASQLLDYGQFTDSLIWSGGNPALRTGLSHKIDTSFGLLNCLTFRAQAEICPDQVEYLYDSATGMRPDGITGPYVTFVPRNVNYRRVDFIASYNKNFGLWSVNSSLQWVLMRYKCADFTTEMNMRLPSLNLMLTRTIPTAGIWAALKYVAAKSPSMGAQEKGWYKFDYIRISLSKSFLKNRLYAGLEYIPPVHLFSNSRVVTLTSPGYVSTVITTSERHAAFDNRLYFNLSYRFSNGKQVRRYNRSLSGQ